MLFARAKKRISPQCIMQRVKVILGRLNSVVHF